jgi:predicted Ser/Thr protein kinase
MSQAGSTHPSPHELAAFARGQVSPQAQDEIARHVAGCAACCAVLRAVPDDTLLERLRQAAATPADPAPETAAPPGRTTADAALAVPPELAQHPRYRILRLLGTGGMGVVYQAEHRLMERIVALKVLSRDLTSNRLAAERFRREVKAAARLAHPNIVTAHDADQAGDLHFLVMEYVEGQSLARLVEQHGPLAVADACHYARQTAFGLQHAFEQGMVHRDVKPHNLMLTPNGRVKILDFGLARLAQRRRTGLQAPAGPRGPAGRGLAVTGIMLGTPDYIAPEQVQDPRRADIRADVYSLGCTLYFLLTGRPPFPGGTLWEKAQWHLDTPPPPARLLRGDLPPGLAAVLDRLMAKDPAQRFQTPAEVVAALALFSRATPVPVAGRAPLRPPGPGGRADTAAPGPDDSTLEAPAPAAKCRRLPRRRALAALALGATACLLIAGGLAGLLGRRGPGDKAPAPLPAPPPRGSCMSYRSARSGFPTTKMSRWP